MVWLTNVNHLKRRELEQVKPADTLGPKGKGSGVDTQAISTADEAPLA